MLLKLQNICSSYAGSSPGDKAAGVWSWTFTSI